MLIPGKHVKPNLHRACMTCDCRKNLDIPVNEGPKMKKKKIDIKLSAPLTRPHRISKHLLFSVPPVYHNTVYSFKYKCNKQYEVFLREYEHITQGHIHKLSSDCIWLPAMSQWPGLSNTAGWIHGIFPAQNARSKASRRYTWNTGCQDWYDNNNNEKIFWSPLGSTAVHHCRETNGCVNFFYWYVLCLYYEQTDMVCLLYVKQAIYECVFILWNRLPSADLYLKFVHCEK